MTRSPYDRLRELASDWEAQVRHRRADHIAARAMLQSEPVRRRMTRPLAAATALAAATVGVVGLGAVADGAVPGQVLYPIDRAYESMGEFVGVTTNRGEERLIEALELMARGRGSDAVVLVDEALAHFERDPDLAQVSAAVAEAASRPPTTTTRPQADPAPVPTDSIDPAPAPPTTTPAPPATSPTTTPAPPAPAPSDQPVLTAAEAADPVISLRVATEYLLRTVRDAKRAIEAGTDGATVDEVRTATENVLAASAAVKEGEGSQATTVAADDTTTTSSTTTTSTTTTSTTTTSTTTTSTTTTSTTTTTLVDGEEGTGPGPIILPPIP